jgi:hypothetical protein
MRHREARDVTHIEDRAQSIKPIAIRAYIDKSQVWLERPLTAKQQAWMRAQCGPGGLHVHNGCARFAPMLTQRLQLRQPALAALEMLAQRDDAYPNILEVALDWIFASEEEREHAQRLYYRHAVKPYHRGTVRYYQQTRYSDAQGRATNSAAYPEEYCRITGELNVLHIEWRITGKAALQRAGLAQLSDIIAINQRPFWSKRLRLADINAEMLGRRANNRQTKGRRRHPLIISYNYNVDSRTGNTLMRTLQSRASLAREEEYRQRYGTDALDQHEYCIQDVLDNIDFDMRSCIEWAEIEHLLPDHRDFEENPTKRRVLEATVQDRAIYYKATCDE